ncbi:Rve domain containing hypothetical protein [Phytophthora palmivora]|uniref:Uncharacterized protein n=1 Tax=Phytophthora palmivora TaxID=4796 RepID=A0A2P4XGC0_9STRA|nr:Rve domain containing hypothetical protein [Phytophthora palmivora]
MTPRYRLNNRYMINFIDHKSNYCRVFLARTKDAAVKQFKHFLVFFEKQRFLFCKKAGVAHQRSEANNQASIVRAKLMHRTIMNMARCMIFGVRAAVELLGDAVQYAVYVLNRSPTNLNREEFRL